MTDSERVVQRLERQIKNAHNENNDFAYIPIGTARMIISLLEKDKPVPAEMEGGRSTWWVVCGDCHGAINDGDRYCRHCGRSVKWA